MARQRSKPDEALLFFFFFLYEKAATTPRSTWGDRTASTLGR